MKEQQSRWEEFGLTPADIAELDQILSSFRTDLDLLLKSMEEDYDRGELLPSGLIFKLLMKTMEYTPLSPDSTGPAVVSGPLLIKFIMIFAMMLHDETLRRKGEGMPLL